MAAKKKAGGKRQKRETVTAQEPVVDEIATKSKVGRPSKYDPSMCDRIVALGAEGKSKAQIRRDLGIHHSTWGEWAGKYPEFTAAIKEADELSMAWWEDLGMDGINKGMKFNATAYIFQVKNRFPWKYRDRQEHAVEHTGKAGGPIEHKQVSAEEMARTDPREALRMFESFRVQQSSGPTTH